MISKPRVHDSDAQSYKRGAIPRRNYLKAAGSAAVGLSSLTGCLGSGGGGAKGKEVKFLLAEGGADVVDFFNEVGAGFEEETGADFELELTPVGTDYVKRVTQLIQAGTPPEITAAGTAEAYLFDAFNLLEPIDGAMDVVNERFGSPPEWSQLKNDDGQNLLVPVFGASSNYWYREDLLEDAGLSADFKPDTWEQVLKYCESMDKLDVPSHGTYVPANGNAGNPAFILEGWVRSAGGRFTKYDGEKWVAAFGDGKDRDRMIEALNFMKEQHKYSPEAASSTWTNIGHCIETETSASVVYTGARPKNYAIKNQRPFAENIATVLGPEGRTPKTRGQAESLCVFKNSNTEAAKKFIEYVTRTEYFAQFCWITAMVHNAPLYPSVINSQQYQDYLNSVPEWRPKDYQTYFENLRKNGVPNPAECDPPNPYFSVVENSLAVSQMINDVLVKNKNPDNILDGYAKRLTDILVKKKNQAEG